MMDLVADWHVGDSLTVLRTLPDASVDLVLTSPPFLALRSYLPADHPDKDAELGSEASPGGFVDALLDVIVECRRVLAPHGSLVVELGDTYSGSGGAGGDYGKNGLRDGQPTWSGSANRVGTETMKEGFTGRRGHGAGGGTGWPLAKSLTLIPETVRFALAYGINPHTGRTVEPWRIRNVIRWCRTNPPVGSLADKFRPATSELLVACVAKDRYFDLDAVRMPSATDDSREVEGPQNYQPVGQPSRQTFRTSNQGGAPPLDWWNIPTQGFKGSHYATWPKNLLVKPIMAMCPEKVCNECGKPSTRIAETTNAIGEAAGRRSWRNDPENIGAGHTGEITRSISSAPTANRVTLGWSDCGHDNWRRGIVLDPFAGSGTTLEVATGLGRSCIGIDLDERNLLLAERRVGMFLTVI